MSSPFHSIGKVLGHYRLVEQIGAGGMGVVYRAHDEHLDRDVAVKVLPAGTLNDDATRARFRREALALAKLNHPNIATVHEFGTQDGVDYLVTEYIPGITLNDKLRIGPLLQEEALQLGAQLTEGLEAAHEQGVVHRDLKPANLRLTPKGQLKILDFGLAKHIQPLSDTSLTETLHHEEVLTGTLPYMAPEQLRGERVDHRSDIWAAGAVLYEMATAKRPFPDKHGPLLIDAILHQPPPSPAALNSQVSPALDSIILKALEKDPERRYQSARQLRNDLKKVLSAPTGVTTIVARAVRPTTRLIRALTILGAAIVASLLLGVLGWRLWHTSKPTASSQRVLAVLPFKALGGEPETGALGSGMTQTLTARLAQVSDRGSLQLVSSSELEGQGIKTADQARRDFGVDLVIEGSLQQSGPLVRINCSLVDPITHRQLSARTITAAANDIFGLEDRVVNEVLDILAIEIRPDQRDNLHPQQETKPAAYESYLRARGYLQDYHKAENIQSAIGQFNRALEIDPTFGRAYAGLGEAYWRDFLQSNQTNDSIAKAAANCEKSASLSAQLAEAHICLGDVYNGRGEYQNAVEQFKRAVALDANNPDALRGLADAYDKVGNSSAAEASYRQALAQRPNYWAGYNWLGAFYFRQARYSEAVEMFRRVVELTPENLQGYSNLGGVYLTQGSYPEAIEALNRSLQIRPNLEAYTNLGTAYFGLRRFAEAAHTYEQGLRLDDKDSLIWGNFGDALYWTPGRRAEAPRAYRKAISLGNAKLQVNPRDATLLAFLATYHAMIGENNTAIQLSKQALALAPGDAEVKFRAALVYNHLGETDQCLDWLEKATTTGYPKSAIRDTPDFDHLHNNPRLQRLLKN